MSRLVQQKSWSESPVPRALVLVCLVDGFWANKGGQDPGTNLSKVQQYAVQWQLRSNFVRERRDQELVFVVSDTPSIVDLSSQKVEHFVGHVLV